MTWSACRDGHGRRPAVPRGIEAARIVALLTAATVGLAACVAGPPSNRSDDRLTPSCRSPAAIALAIRNASEDSPNERRRLPC